MILSYRNTLYMAHYIAQFHILHSHAYTLYITQSYILYSYTYTLYIAEFYILYDYEIIYFIAILILRSNTNTKSSQVKVKLQTTLLRGLGRPNG